MSTKKSKKAPLKDLSSKRADRVKGGTIHPSISTNSTSLASVSPSRYTIKPR